MFILYGSGISIHAIGISIQLLLMFILGSLHFRQVHGKNFNTTLVDVYPSFLSHFYFLL